MIQSCTVMGLVTARGNSKGVLRKNLKNLRGKSLIEWTIARALHSRFIDRLMISSDNQEILTVARNAGCEVPFVRPARLAADETPHAEVVSHALAEIEEQFDYIVVLQPTSPLRVTEDIDACIELCHARGAPSTASVTKFDKNPQTLVEIDSEGKLRVMLNGTPRTTRRQETDTYILNGAVYVCRCDWWRECGTLVGEQTLGYVMPFERSIDIDSDFDFEMAELLLSREQANA